MTDTLLSNIALLIDADNASASAKSYLDGIADALEMRQDARVVPGLAEDVEILGRARDARIG